MVLAHAEHRAAVGRDVAVGPAVAPRHGRLGRHGDRLAGRARAGRGAGRPSSTNHSRPRPDPPRAAAVLVGGRAGVPPVGQDLDRRAVRPAAGRAASGPPSSGRRSPHQTSSPSTTTAPKPTAARTTSSEVIGVGQDPNGRTAGADGAAGSAMARIVPRPPRPSSGRDGRRPAVTVSGGADRAHTDMAASPSRPSRRGPHRAPARSAGTTCRWPTSAATAGTLTADAAGDRRPPGDGHDRRALRPPAR